jgi:hypothetical protein
MKYDKNYSKYLLSFAIENRLKDDNKTHYNLEMRKHYLRDKFYNEAGYQVEKVGLQKALADWLAGLPLNIPYTNGEIVKFSVYMGSANPTKCKMEGDFNAYEWKIINNYWLFMANQIIKIFKSIKKPTPTEIKESEVLGQYFFSRDTMRDQGQRMKDFKTEWHDIAKGIVRLYAPKQGRFLPSSPMIYGTTERFIKVTCDYDNGFDGLELAK